MRLLKIFTVCTIVMLGVYAARHHTAEDAAMNCHEIQNCLDDGYWIESCTPNPIMYLIAPTGHYEWGTFSTQLRCDPATGNPPVYVTCSVKAHSKNGKVTFRETHNNVVIPIR